LVQHSLYVLLLLQMHLEVFPADPWISSREKENPPLMTFRPTRTCYPTRAASILQSPEGFQRNFPPITRRLSRKTRLTLLRFSRPSALWKLGATYTGLTFPGCAALSGFLNLSAPYSPSLPSRPCFIPLTLLGFHPPEVSPH
jgi:hypothetical protein